MSEIVLVPSAEQDAYWQEFTQLQLATCYIRDYRNSIGRFERGVAILRAITSSVSIAAWAIWRQHAILWGTFIAAAQVADALKEVLPLHKRRQALSRWSNALNRLFVDAQRDWENLSTGKIKDERISSLTHQLRLKMQRYEAKYAPDGLRKKERLFLAAQTEMKPSSGCDILKGTRGKHMEKFARTTVQESAIPRATIKIPMPKGVKPPSTPPQTAKTSGK